MYYYRNPGSKNLQATELISFDGLILLYTVDVSYNSRIIFCIISRLYRQM